MQDIVEKLRAFGPDWSKKHNNGEIIPYQICVEAADEIARLRSRPLPSEGDGGWQPIETAPKDGKEFLATLSNGWVVILYAPKHLRDGDRFSWWGSSGPVTSIPYVPSHHADTDWKAAHTILATHWMLLPAPPPITPVSGEPPVQSKGERG